MTRRQERDRPPPMHERSITLCDPDDLTVRATDRLISARAILTPYIRAVDLLEAFEASKVAGITNPLKLPDAPHARWARKHKKADNATREWDQDELNSAAQLIDSDSIAQADIRSGHTKRRNRGGWPPHVSYGSEEWIQLRWRPFWLLDRDQKWMDRFELGETWWQAIHNDPRFPTERSFDSWRNDMKTGYRGVIWSAPTDRLKGVPPGTDRAWDGRLVEPAQAMVVVSSTRRPRRTARWPLFLPNPEWPPAIRKLYADRRYAGHTDWRSLSARLDVLAHGGVTDVESLARQLLQARTDARRRRRR